ncbi:rasGEF domain-containing protein [Ditylenchus destructor]|uniref:RasGEF domain-containing protein n=1 Tax=Ditylenchus destructor TaxID=166010 RepID=A0AAD4MLE1_9BILA|nr:rasGEF domain-containing protein [Ditylenchus destructor]
MNFPSCSTASDDELNVFTLVRRCCECFDEHGEITSEDLPHCLLLVGEYLMENVELMAQFVALYQDEGNEFDHRVCAAVGYWIRHFPMHFDANSQLCALVDRLKKMAIKDGRINETLINDLDLSSVPSYAWMRNVSVRNPVSRHVSLSFEQWSPEDLSNAISHVDYRVLSRVTIPEIKRYIRLNKLSQTPVLERSIAVFNSLSCWVQCMILSKPTAKERADIMTKFVNVGKHLRRQYNFNTLMAVIGGVTHSNISRLLKTHALLEEDVKKELTELTQLLSNSNNFANYRKALQEVRVRFKIPIMGIHLKDLIAWHGAGLDFEKTRRISERKLYQLGNLLGHFLGVSFDISYNENDIYDLSLKREPRTLLNFPSAVHSKPVVFADWASGVLPAPDPETINKHITAMVDAVFKHYDNDRDNYISKSEFEQIAGNFPFLDSFVAIDMDRDGQISKSEMTAYFLNLNKQLAEFRRGFKHNFVETTFLTPATCAHCKKLLWGLIRQGFKCKDCGLVVHEACKDVAVVECRLKNSATQNGTTAGTTIAAGFTDWLSSPRSNGAKTSHNNKTTPIPSSGRKPIHIAYRNKSRTVSTVSESPTPSPELPAVSTDTSDAEAGFGILSSANNTLRSSFHRFIRSAKSRTSSDPNECMGVPSSHINSNVQNPPLEHQASLASEEVFEEDNSADNSSARNGASELPKQFSLTSRSKGEPPPFGDHKKLTATTPITSSRFYIPSPILTPTKKRVQNSKKTDHNDVDKSAVSNGKK